MGTIQQSVNNALVTGTALASLNPGLQQKAKNREELRSLKSQEKNLDTQITNLIPEVDKNSNSAVVNKEFERLDQLQDDITTRKYMLDPKNEAYAKDYFRMQHKLAFYDHVRMQQANEAAQSQSNIKKSQKTNFKSHLDNMSTSLGVQVGDLPENIRRQVEAAYNNNGGNK